MKRSAILFFSFILFTICIVESNTIYAGKSNVDLSKLQVKEQVILKSNQMSRENNFHVPIGKSFYIVIENTGRFPLGVKICSSKSVRGGSIERHFLKGKGIKREVNFKGTTEFFAFPANKGLTGEWALAADSDVSIELESRSIQMITKKAIFGMCGGYTSEVYVPGSEGSVTIYEQPTTRSSYSTFSENKLELP